jgi:hypothetical protein
MRYTVVFATLVLGMVGCEHLSESDKATARQLLEACLRESWTQGEAVGRFGVACAAMNDWARRQGWAAQPSSAAGASQ